MIFGKWMKHSGWWPDYQIRLFRKGYVTWTDVIHGVPITRGRGLDLEIADAVCIVHYNYSSIEQYFLRMNRYSTISAKEMYMANTRFILSDLFEKPTQEFIRRYFVWEGYKDGLHGLILSLMQSFSELMVYCKLWELEGMKERTLALKDVHGMVTKNWKQQEYWFIQELLKQPLSLPQKLSLHVRRKLKHHE